MHLQTRDTVATLNTSGRIQLPFKERPIATPGAQAPIKTRLPPKLFHCTLASSHMHHRIHHTIEGNQRMPLCGPQPLLTLAIRMLDVSRGYYVSVEANLNDSSNVRSFLVLVRTLINQ